MAKLKSFITDEARSDIRELLDIDESGGGGGGSATDGITPDYIVTVNESMQPTAITGSLPLSTFADNDKLPIVAYKTEISGVSEKTLSMFSSVAKIISNGSVAVIASITNLSNDMSNDYAIECFSVMFAEQNGALTIINHRSVEQKIENERYTLHFFINNDNKMSVKYNIDELGAAIRKKTPLFCDFEKDGVIVFENVPVTAYDPVALGIASAVNVGFYIEEDGTITLSVGGNPGYVLSPTMFNDVIEANNYFVLEETLSGMLFTATLTKV